MATVSFSMYFPLMLPFENRGALSKVLENVWGLLLIILFLYYAKEPYAIGSKLTFELLKILKILKIWKILKFLKFLKF